ncbi:Thymine dioxygenase [Mycena venus]|uniref:Thymine dioxygenase n=1 Tax=Mycena venus TaxID=2733690 RepID=A0A8H6YNX4_9AGAR|nr:Thymine dioxygenase [Mycena venus]
MGGAQDVGNERLLIVSHFPYNTRGTSEPIPDTPLPTDNSMSSVALTENQGNASISVVDFAPFLDGSNKQGVADEILSSFKRVGFVYLLNHGLPQDRIAKMFAVSKEFFAQPTEVKELAPHPPSGTHHRGYSAPGREKIVQPTFIGEGVNRPTVPDVKEHFECGREDNTAKPNIWLPDGILPGFKETCLEFFWLCHEVEMNVLRSLAVGFGLAEDYFTQYHGKADNQLRLLHYPRYQGVFLFLGDTFYLRLPNSVPAEAMRNERIGRITAHSDYASLTLLLQDDVGGLEIEDPNVAGLFRPAPPIPGALIVNVADFMMRWSNDTIRSTIHRVRAPQACETPDGMIPERYSIPYVRPNPPWIIFTPTSSHLPAVLQRSKSPLHALSPAFDRETVLDCIPGTWDQENPKKYEPISAGEYTRKRLAAAY